MQQLRTDILHIVAKFAMRKTVGGETVNDAERVAELVIETRPDNACGQGMAHIADTLADVIPDVRYFAGSRIVLKSDEYCRHASTRKAAQKIEFGCFLQSALESLGDLFEHVVDARAGPCGLHDHGLDDKGGVFVASEPHEREKPSQDSHYHQIDGQ